MTNELYSNEDIRQKFEIISDDKYRQLVEEMVMPDYLYGSLFPEKNYFIKEREHLKI